MLAEDFERAIVADATLPGRRFAVYRNNILAALSGALAVRYPVVKRLTGPDFFRAMAVEFVRSHRARSPVFAEYGGEFPAFIERHGPAVSVLYLADVARLESAWWLAYHAADGLPLKPEAFTVDDGEDLAERRFKFLPSLSIVESRWPIVAIWRAHQAADDLSHIDLERGEAALVVRPRLDVIVRALGLGEALFLSSLIDGKTLGQAFEIAGRAEVRFDLQPALELIIATEIVAAIDRRGPS